jgi:hypothetical protein
MRTKTGVLFVNERGRWFLGTHPTLTQASPSTVRRLYPTTLMPTPPRVPTESLVLSIEIVIDKTEQKA